MSTRGQIRIEGNDNILLYKHSDSYPSGTLPVLLPFVAEFMKYRGFDPEYMTARLMQRLCNASDDRAKQWQKELAANGMSLASETGKPEFLGYGLDCQIHGDIEYFYVVKKDGSVDVQKVRFGSERSDPETTNFPSLGIFKVGTSVEEALRALGDEGK